MFDMPPINLTGGISLANELFDCYLFLTIL